MEKHRSSEVGSDAVTREAARPVPVRNLQALLVASGLVASLSAAGGEPRRAKVTLSVEARPREEAHSPRLEVWREEGVLSLRVVDPGRLVVKAGVEVIAAGALGWGEDQRLRIEPLVAYPPTAMPRAVNREPGREEVEVHVPAGVGAGELLTLTYEWDWKHAGKPALVRTWMLPLLEQDLPPEWLEEELSEPELEDTPEDEADTLAFLSLQETPFPVQVDPEWPESLWVPGHASREELASRLFGDASAVGAFDFEPLAAPPDSEGGPRSRALHPLEWVRVEVHGPQPRTHLMTAMELALLASLPDTPLLWTALGRIGELHMYYGAVSALARAPLLSGVAATGAQEGAVAGARRAAVRQFIGRMSLVTTLAVVDTWRDELSRTPEGRAFLAVHDVAMLALAGRDISKLATSGIWRELAHRGGRVLSQSGARASAGLRESVELAQALAKTVERMLAEGKAVATPDGLRFSLSGGAEAFKQAFFAIRGELAAARALGGIRGAGLAAQEAGRTLDALKLLAAESQELARAYSAVARRAAALPADKAQAYLAAVESLRASARSAAKPALAELLRRSGAPSLADPLAFLKEAEWLVRHPELDAEAVGTLARKACEGRVDLGWLRSTGLTLEDLNFMARDKRTPWRLFRGAAAEPGNWTQQRRAREQLRGIAGEMLTERNARKLFPGFRMTGRQVKLEGGRIIDHELTSMDGSRLRHGVEVKGWNENRWRKALDAWRAKQGTNKLDEEQEELVKQLQRLLDQLADAAKAPRGSAFLVSTDKLSGPTRFKLISFLEENAPDTLLIQIEEAKILEKTKQLRAALNLPEELSGGVP